MPAPNDMSETLKVAEAIKGPNPYKHNYDKYKEATSPEDRATYKAALERDADVVRMLGADVAAKKALEEQLAVLGKVDWQNNKLVVNVVRASVDEVNAAIAREISERIGVAERESRYDEVTRLRQGLRDIGGYGAALVDAKATAMAEARAADQIDGMPSLDMRELFGKAKPGVSGVTTYEDNGVVRLAQDAGFQKESLGGQRSNQDDVEDGVFRDANTTPPREVVPAASRGVVVDAGPRSGGANFDEEAMRRDFFGGADVGGFGFNFKNGEQVFGKWKNEFFGAVATGAFVGTWGQFLSEKWLDMESRRTEKKKGGKKKSGGAPPSPDDPAPKPDDAPKRERGSSGMTWEASVQILYDEANNRGPGRREVDQAKAERNRMVSEAKRSGLITQEMKNEVADLYDDIVAGYRADVQIRRASGMPLDNPRVSFEDRLRQLQAKHPEATGNMEGVVADWYDGVLRRLDEVVAGKKLGTAKRLRIDTSEFEDEAKHTKRAVEVLNYGTNGRETRARIGNLADCEMDWLVNDPNSELKDVFERAGVVDPAEARPDRKSEQVKLKYNLTDADIALINTGEISDVKKWLRAKMLDLDKIGIDAEVAQGNVQYALNRLKARREAPGARDLIRDMEDLFLLDTATVAMDKMRNGTTGEAISTASAKAAKTKVDEIYTGIEGAPRLARLLDRTLPTMKKMEGDPEARKLLREWMDQGAGDDGANTVAIQAAEAAKTKLMARLGVTDELDMNEVIKAYKLIGRMDAEAAFTVSPASGAKRSKFGLMGGTRDELAGLMNMGEFWAKKKKLMNEDEYAEAHKRPWESVEAAKKRLAAEYQLQVVEPFEVGVTDAFSHLLSGADAKKYGAPKKYNAIRDISGLDLTGEQFVRLMGTSGFADWTQSWVDGADTAAKLGAFYGKQSWENFVSLYNAFGHLRKYQRDVDMGGGNTANLRERQIEILMDIAFNKWLELEKTKLRAKGEAPVVSAVVIREMTDTTIWASNAFGAPEDNFRDHLKRKYQITDGDLRAGRTFAELGKKWGTIFEAIGKGTKKR